MLGMPLRFLQRFVSPCFHQWVENLKTRIIITNKTVALAKEFVIAPYLGVGRGKKEKKKVRGGREANKPSHDNFRSSVVEHLFIEYLDEEDI